ncbi:hypothetical protein MSAN_01918000 [Mycena sanguinolenta]|uniref:Uncharacterized protein n=1 Tax=Mycena sanguinolenta TaxID=230812 RepID=A0A8H6XME1_9AGAR|nr:hypothetical protein MSAN_01918000 [Mycena sanguinolenta]
MFAPFTDATDFYPGLIVWCDPACYESDLWQPGPREKKSRELRPCLIISVNYNTRTFQGARLSATTPADPSQWAKIDSPPVITWKLNNAFIWVGTPPTISMIFDDVKVMHPHKDPYYSTHPVSTANLQNYWMHRQMRARSSTKHTYQEHNNKFDDRAAAPFVSPPHRHAPPRAQEQGPTYASPLSAFNHSATVYFQPQATHQSAALSTISPRPPMIGPPPGFTETREGYPGWLRNPSTGWFWNASCGLMPPSNSRTNAASVLHR